jgi:pimeloyl-ACP methyl ester carboxylesterase
MRALVQRMPRRPMCSGDAKGIARVVRWCRHDLREGSDRRGPKIDHPAVRQVCGVELGAHRCSDSSRRSGDEVRSRAWRAAGLLVGQSGGGPAAQYAADRLAEQTRRIVFVDAWVLHDGEAINDVMPAQFVESSVLAAKESADQTVAMDPQVWAGHFMNGASEHDIATVTNKLVPVPFGWLSEPVSLPGFWRAALPSSYVFLRQDLAVPQRALPRHGRPPGSTSRRGLQRPALGHADPPGPSGCRADRRGTGAAVALSHRAVHFAAVGMHNSRNACRLC